MAGVVGFMIVALIIKKSRNIYVLTVTLSLFPVEAMESNIAAIGYTKSLILNFELQSMHRELMK